MSLQAPPEHGPAEPPSGDAGAPLRGAPIIWVLTTEMVGDNAQLLAIANALGTPFVIKPLRFSGLNRYHFRFFGASLRKLDPASAGCLTPPWPDIVLATGRHCTPVVLWIQKMSKGHTKIVYHGQSWIDPAAFDLFIANPQYYQPLGSNVFSLQFPLLFPNREKIARETEAWRARLQSLPRPWTVLLVGGPTGPHRLDASVADDLMRHTTALLERHGGSLIVSTSRRTPESVSDLLEAAMPADGLFFRWTPEMKDNPYLALLELADRFVVTAESVSMVMEVARLGKPLAIFPLPHRRRKLLKRMRTRLRNALLSPRALEGGWLRARLGTRLVGLGWLSYRREFSRLYDRLVERGLAVYANLPPGSPGPPGPPGHEDEPGEAVIDERPQVATRILALLGSEVRR